MNTKECPRCAGDGLIGSGPQPWLRQGAVVSCPDCGGTGMLNEDGSAYVIAETPSVPVDNAPAPAASGGILKKLFG